MIKCILHIRKVYSNKNLREFEEYEEILSPGIRVLNGLFGLEKQRMNISLHDFFVSIDDEMKRHRIEPNPEMTVEEFFKSLKRGD